MKKSMQLWCRLACVGISLLLVSCGDRGKGEPPEQKRVVIGTSAHIKAKRDSTRGSGKALPFGVSHVALKDGKPLVADAPHPYTMSSGNVLVNARNNGLVQIAYHEDAKGTASSAVPSRLLVSDVSIVSDAVVDPTHPNAVLVTLTGKKGNSYITALDARGDAISKFMVLSAEPAQDVLVVSDPDIHPMLCKGLGFRDEPLSCYTTTATDFDIGHVGDQFNMDHYLKNGSPEKKFILFDDASTKKLMALNSGASDSFEKKAIYFEHIDTLFVMNDGVSKLAGMRVIGSGTEGELPSRNALAVKYVATQEEFNSYIDYGGSLTSSPLRDYTQQDILSHVITPDQPAEAVLVGVVLSDDTRLSASVDSLQQLELSSRYPIKTHIYQLRQKGNTDLSSGLECHASVTAGKLLKFGLKSLKSVATVSLGGNFDWSGGRPRVGLNLNPQVNVGGMLNFGLNGRVAMTCGLELLEVKIAEWGIPVFGNVHVALPLELKVELGVNGTGELVLSLPAYDLGSPDGTSRPGKVGVQYSPDGGFKTDFAMKSTLAKDRMGVAEGTKLTDDAGKVKDKAIGEIGMSHEAGIAAGLHFRAKVSTWIFHAEVDASVAEVMVGASTEGKYTIDTDQQTSKRTGGEGVSGIGAFFSASPTIQVKTNFFTLSFNLFELKADPIWFYKLPFKEEKDEAFEPIETTDAFKFDKCRKYSSPCSQQKDSIPYAVDYVTSSQKFEITESSSMPFDGASSYAYKYIFKDKVTGDLVYKEIPMVQVDELDYVHRAYKYGVTNVLAEAVVSSVIQNDAGYEDHCKFWAKGDESFTKTFDCPWRR